MSEEKPDRKRRSLLFVGLLALAVGATVLGLALLVNIFQRKQEARIHSSGLSSSPTTRSIRVFGERTFHSSTTTI